MSVKETEGVVLLREKETEGRLHGRSSFQVLNTELQKTNDINCEQSKSLFWGRKMDLPVC